MPGKSSTAQQGEPSVPRQVRPNTRSTKATRFSTPRTEDPYSKYGNKSSPKAHAAADASHPTKFHQANVGGAESRLGHENVEEEDSESTSESEEEKPQQKYFRQTGRSQAPTRRVSFGAPPKRHQRPGVAVPVVQPARPVTPPRKPQDTKATVEDAEEEGSEGSQQRTSNQTKPASLYLPGSFSTEVTHIDDRRFMEEGKRRSSSHDRPTPPGDIPALVNLGFHDPTDAFGRFQNRERLDPDISNHGFRGYPPDHNPTGFCSQNPPFSPSMANPNPFAPYSPLPPHLQPVHLGQRPPPTGHELLASMLTGGTSGLVPMYRRFEALNHRLLLHLQDEISELEEQLSALDAADTQERSFPGGVYPASRRLSNSSSDVRWRRTTILGTIGYRLETYNRILASFKQIMEFPTPLVGEVNDYITYLDNQQPIVDMETKFLDCHQDLITFSQYSVPSPRVHMRSHGDHGSNVSTRSTPTSKKNQMARKAALSDSALRDVILGILLAIFVPIVSFGTIPGFGGRMTVVFVVAGGVVLTLIRSGALKTLAQSRSGLDGLVCLGAYGVVMAIIARALG